MKLAYQYMAIFFTLLHLLQVENCGSNSRLVVDEDDKVNSGLKGLTLSPLIMDIIVFNLVYLQVKSKFWEWN